MTLTATNTIDEISCRGVWKVFGRQPEKTVAAIQAGQTRSDILSQTGHLVAVRDVSFDVQKGETFVVMGLSGSGKSTLVRCLSRLIEPTRGEIRVEGQNVMEMDARQLRELRRHRISMVFQNFGLFPHRRVIENVAYGLEVQGLPKKLRLDRAEQMLALVGLAGWESHYPQQLSGGMQQRVGLARALAVDPQILFFDEPFSALDPLIRRDMQDELINLRTKMRKTIIFITHDFAEALRLGDHIAIMKNGEFMQMGTAAQLVTHPANDYVRAFTKDAPRAKILTAADIMQPCADSVMNESGSTTSTKTTLEGLLPLVAASDAPVRVVDEEQRCLGCVGRESVLRALSEAA
jgi:glycine betaine/proline transport system ATP-binding protein